MLNTNIITPWPRVQRRNISKFVVLVSEVRVFQEDLLARLCGNFNGFIKASIDEELKHNLQSEYDACKTCGD